MAILRLLSVGGLVVAIVFLVSPQIAYADPHALFYTAVGQQQLFFNMLAALDQADYVEPAIDSLGTSQKDSRQEVLDQRAASGFGPETDKKIDSTKTELASILTRSITLEGSDLWTAFLVHQFALETARRNASDEVIRVYCERGLGRKNCENDIEDPKEREEGQKQAFVVDPAERSADVYFQGVDGVLSSDFRTGSYDQEQRDQAVEDKTPRPFSQAIASLRSQSASDPLRSSAVERTIQGVQNSFLTSPPNPNALNDLTVNSSTGEVILQESDSENPGSYIDRYAGALTNLFTLPSTLRSTALQGASTVQHFQDTAEEQGAVADTHVALQGGSQGAKQNVSGRISVPAHAKVAFTEDALETLANTEQNLKYAVPKAESIPGTVQSVERNQQQSGPTARSYTDTQEEGSVAGIINPVPPIGLAHHSPKPELDPRSNLIQFHHEQGPAHLLSAAGYDIENGGCGCNLRSAINDHGPRIIDAINRFAL